MGVSVQDPWGHKANCPKMSRLFALYAIVAITPTPPTLETTVARLDQCGELEKDRVLFSGTFSGSLGWHFTDSFGGDQ